MNNTMGIIYITLGALLILLAWSGAELQIVIANSAIFLAHTMLMIEVDRE